MEAVGNENNEDFSEADVFGDIQWSASTQMNVPTETKKPTNNVRTPLSAF